MSANYFPLIYSITHLNVDGNDKKRRYIVEMLTVLIIVNKT